MRESAAEKRPIWLWTLAGVLALVFLAAGGSKLAGLPENAENFARWGYPGWFMYLTGTIEVSSAVALLIRRVTGSGALALSATMLGAIATHLLNGEGGAAVVPLVLLVALGALVWTQRGLLPVIGAPPTSGAQP